MDLIGHIIMWFSITKLLVTFDTNNHFEDEDDEAKDLELANQIQIASSSSSNDFDSISSLISSQTRSNFYHVKDGLISLLRNYLELETKHTSSITILSGYVDHFQSHPFVDVGCGSGWRNIQMLSSHFFPHRQEARQVLFGGSGFVPPILLSSGAALRLLGKGVLIHLVPDILTAKSMVPIIRLGLLNALLFFRSFGLRARAVDFGPKESQRFYLSVPGFTLGQPVMKRNAIQVSGPMDRYVHHQQGSKKRRHSFDSLGNGKSANSKGKSERPQILVDWVWNYFSDKGLTISGSSNNHCQL
ncbi:hypothetical protein REPUB_Repub07fG0164600 [Reevesia pubescens]